MLERTAVPPGSLKYKRNIVPCTDNPVPGRTLTSLAVYGTCYGISVSWLTAADARRANCEAPERAEVPTETFARAHPSGCRRHLPFTRSWVTTGLHRDLRPPLIVMWILGVTPSPASKNRRGYCVRTFNYFYLIVIRECCSLT